MRAAMRFARQRQKTRAVYDRAAVEFDIGARIRRHARFIIDKNRRLMHV